ncbi:protein of unknown function - conserved [Leishmania donovani]|uniref:Uncharacterized protein n=3 Tax=Leishmania donovani species complex TaxID=38574 RepID=A4HU39_LEIIN|nr:conserved hypothetical protein [Leishmania infantum JPCM5]XP_003858801.1 hypothetical protein, conserved [Leishmania donovani]CAC9455182.1 hypothetical_protein_-__conserved [Leishmania infantum]AYU76564.1 hypothetical protein LdCL_090018700 [Leishmania donovani]TPP41669.1 hypothetical protein CGC21_36770 [Leishmania donovani]TPP42819.1 hypothetical protein CGC20_7920 [Leishmania donovani]CAJ1986633.1 protein of unknown function - conserved [Leishmania donovani]|eukprot:XP_001463580.1 conserved hypothetical protein [Leishmania infantum JPCM5]
MSNEEVFRISNVSGYSVEMPLATAKELLGMLNMDQVFRAARAGTDDTDESDVDDGDTEPVKAEGTDYSKEVLDVVRAYALLPPDERTSSIPRPLTQDLRSVVYAGEMELVEKAEREDYLVDLLNCALFLRFSQLSALCAAYMAVRIDEIAKAAPDIMEGAERIRKFLHMQNEWTEEEMGHLRREMEYAKSVDPNVY